MDLQTLLKSVITLLNSLIPFILAIAFLVFLWNMMRYFIVEGANQKEHENAKSLALWGIIAFVIIIGIWGIVRLLISEVGIGTQPPIVPDYMKTGGAGSGVGISGGGNGIGGATGGGGNGDTTGGGGGDATGGFNFPITGDTSGSNSNSGNWDNYGFVDGADTDISPDP